MAMGKADESLRSTRLVFYKEDIEKIAKGLRIAPSKLFESL